MEQDHASQVAQVTHPRAWARTVALNYHRAQHRNQAEFSLGIEVDPPSPGPGHAELTGQARDLIALLCRLDEDCRTVIAFDLDDIATSQIAAALGTSQQKVRDLRRKARKHLRRHLRALADRERETHQ